ncbi:MAG TPA: hypothetical protein VFS67_30930 [Polyangiaceae bacterium]|nr:hypothetical protein [Polyangiaceae bacterium]
MVLDLNHPRFVRLALELEVPLDARNSSIWGHILATRGAGRAEP